MQLFASFRALPSSHPLSLCEAKSLLLIARRLLDWDLTKIQGWYRCRSDKPILEPEESNKTQGKWFMLQGGLLFMLGLLGLSLLFIAGMTHTCFIVFTGLGLVWFLAGFVSYLVGRFNGN